MIQNILDSFNQTEVVTSTKPNLVIFLIEVEGFVNYLES